MKKLGAIKILGLALGCAALVLASLSASAQRHPPRNGFFTAHAGTTFVLAPIAGSPGQFSHTVDGVYVSSLLGDCTFHGEAVMTAPTPPSAVWTITGGAFTITTADGTSTLTASAEGSAVVSAADPNNFDFHYTVTFTGGTGRLAGAHGSAEIVDGLAALALHPGAIDYPGATGVYPPDADLIAPATGSGDLIGKACWLMIGHLEIPGIDPEN
jgi:hypothetical protein